MKKITDLSTFAEKKLGNIQDGPAQVHHFFRWRNRLSDKNYCIIIDRNGNVRIARTRNRDDYRYFQQLWKKWGSMPQEENELLVFEYPTWCLRKDYSFLARSSIIVTVSAVLWVVIFLLHKASHTTMTVAEISHRALLVCSGVLTIPTLVMLLSWWQYPKNYCKIWLIDDGLKVNFIDGETRQFLLKDVKRYHFDDYGAKSSLFFKDGTRLLHLERASYWPILREYLLSKLEPSEKE